MSLFLIAALGVWVSFPINAVGQQRVQNPETHDGDVIPADQGGAALQNGTEEQGSGESISLGIEDATQRLNKVSERLNNPEIGEQIRVITESHLQIQTKAKTALFNMQVRFKTLKFFFGASYKNAREIKAQVAQLRANAEELAILKNSLTSVADQEEIQGAIDSLEVEAIVLENELEQELEGFSLFGWLNRILSGY